MTTIPPTQLVLPTRTWAIDPSTRTAPDPWRSERIGFDRGGAIDRTVALRRNAALPGGAFSLGDEVRLAAGFSAAEEG